MRSCLLNCLRHFIREILTIRNDMEVIILTGRGVDIELITKTMKEAYAKIKEKKASRE